MEESLKLVSFLQSSIAPVALISGVGLILLTLNNRMGRVVDRTRLLLVNLNAIQQPVQKETLIAELRILYRRGKILRSSIAAISLSILTSSLIIIVLLVMNTMPLDLSMLGKFLFVLSVFSILISAVFLFVDIMLTLKALKYEVDQYLEK